MALKIMIRSGRIGLPETIYSVVAIELFFKNSCPAALRVAFPVI
jgi:hypothetical protein